jgi:hypothetical protein
MQAAKELKFFDSISNGHYKSVYSSFEPVHGRKLIEGWRAAMAEYKELSGAGQKKNSKPKKKKEPQKQQLLPLKTPAPNESPSIKAYQPVKAEKKKKKQFSLFWGLIKFSW